jgi:DNA-binding XRE family transcriptional regulator
MEINGESAGLQNDIETAPTPDQKQPALFFDIQKLRTLRKAMRLNQADAATRVGIHRTYFVAIEAGKRIPSPKVQRAIAAGALL